MIKGRNIALPLDFSGRRLPAASAGSVLNFGTSTVPLVCDDAAAGFIVGYFDSGATSGWPAGVYFKLNATGAGASYTALEGDLTLSAAAVNVTGIECFLQVASGGCVPAGGLSACTVTVDFANCALATGGGWYRGATFNIKGEGGSTDPSGAHVISCLELKTEGTWGTTFESCADSFAIVFNGFTSAAGTGKIISSSVPGVLSGLGAVRGVRVGANNAAIDTAPTAYYIPLIPATAWTALSTATQITDSTINGVFINHSFLSAATSGDTKGSSLTLEVTGSGQDYSTCNYNFLYLNAAANVDNPMGVVADMGFATNCWVQGTGAMFGSYCTLPGKACVTGTWGGVNLEYYAPAGGTYVCGARPTLFGRIVLGGDATALHSLEDNAALLSLVGVTNTTGGELVHLHAQAYATANYAGTIRIIINGTDYFIPFQATEA